MIILPFIPIVCLGLGAWQMQRLQWKLALIDDLQDKLQRPAIRLPRNVNIVELPNFEYRKVLLTGTWDHAHSFLLGPKSRENVPGYNLITPLFRPNGASTILVNRGFVSTDLIKSHPELLTKETNVVDSIGLLRSSQVKNSFTPDNNPEKGEWFWADVDAMAQHIGGDAAGVQPVYVEAVFDGNEAEASERIAAGEPIGRSSHIELRNMHLTYAITWFTLGIITGGLFARMTYLRRQKIQAIWKEVGFPGWKKNGGASCTKANIMKPGGTGTISNAFRPLVIPNPKPTSGSALDASASSSSESAAPKSVTGRQAQSLASRQASRQAQKQHEKNQEQAKEKASGKVGGEEEKP